MLLFFKAWAFIDVSLILKMHLPPLTLHIFDHLLLNIPRLIAIFA